MSARILLNADVRTGDSTTSRAEAIAWRDGVIVAVGDRTAVTDAAGEGAESVDVGGRTVVPGFIDAHHHASIVALYGGTLRLTPPTVTDIPSMQEALRSAAARSKDGWIVATNWDEELLAERRAPTRDELDDAVPDRPLVALHYSCHRAVVNSRALEAVGIDPSTPDPSGGVIGRDRRGRPDGLLVERAMSAVESRARASLLASDAEGFFERLAAHYRALAAVGITRVVDATVPGDLIAVYREADRRGILTVPTVVLPVSTKGYLEAPWDAIDEVADAREAGAPTVSASGALVIGPVKLVFDGAPACAMCLGWLQTGGVFVRTIAMAVRHGSLGPLRTTLSTKPRIGAELRTGLMLYRADEAAAIVAKAAERSIGVATHAIGNDAADRALAAYEAAGASLHRGGRARIEHASFLDPRLVARIAAVGAIVTVQPYFLALPAFEHAPAIPGMRNTALRWLLDAGVTVAGSSDHPVTGFDPLDGIRSAVTRRSRRGDVRDADQCVSIDEAIAMYTRGSAEATSSLASCGTLAVGKRADLVVLSEALAPASLDRVQVRATVIGGQCAFGELGAAVD